MKNHPPCVWDVRSPGADVSCLTCGDTIDGKELIDWNKGVTIIEKRTKACILREAIKRVRRPWKPGSQGTMED